MSSNAKSRATEWCYMKKYENYVNALSTLATAPEQD